MPTNEAMMRKPIQDRQEIICTKRSSWQPRHSENEISAKVNPRKAPGFELTGTILKKLPKKGIILLIYLVNAAFRLKYFRDI